MTSRDIAKVVRYWREAAEHDLDTARSLFRTGRYDYCLFLCHLSLEKLLKALVTRKLKEHAPFTTEELYDLDRDPTEQHNIAADEPVRCARLRQRLAAWTEANNRQYAPLGGS